MTNEIVCIFANTKSLGSLWTRFWAKLMAGDFGIETWSHVGIHDVENHVVIEALPFLGVVETPEDSFFERCSETLRVPIDCPDTDAAFSALRTQIGNGYDWFALISIFLRILHFVNVDKIWTIESRRRWTCSELVLWAVRKGGGGKEFHGIKRWLATPTRLFSRIEAT